jgi:hypothetical protein
MCWLRWTPRRIGEQVNYFECQVTWNDQRPIRLFSDRSHYRRENRISLSEVLRPYWKDRPFGDEERRQMYGLLLGDFCLADSLEQADLAVLPLNWNYYLERGELGCVAEFIDAARRAERLVMSYVGGDEGVTVPPEFDDVYVIRASGLRSRKRKRQLAQPVFFDDPLKQYPELGAGTSVVSSQWSVVSGQRSVVSSPWSVVSSLPRIGFCGQASVNAVKVASDVLRAAWRNLLYRFKLRQEEPQPLSSSALLRARAMKTLTESPLIKTRFIGRAKYRGGAATPEARERTTREFYQNIAETDYTLCVRGGGNFSKRFYETLAMGRIPVLVDTDCLLPFESELDWSNYIVRVPREELEALPQAVADHFSKCGLLGLAELKRRCRKLWEEKLTFGGFHRHLARHILASENRAPVPASHLQSAISHLPS